MRKPLWDLVAGPLVAAAILGPGAWLTAHRKDATHATAPAASQELPFRLIESAREARLIHTPERFQPHPSLSNIAPRLASLGAAVAVVDYDGDGWPDVFATDPAVGGRQRLFHNEHDGTFIEKAEAAGLARASGSAGAMRPLFFDFDGDGREDLLLTTTWCPRLWRNKGDGRFEDVTARSGLAHCALSYAANAIDYDGDGRLDLVIADYFKPVDFTTPRDTRFMPDSGVNADNGGPVTVYHNEGGGRFKEVPGGLGMTGRGWTLAVGVYDLRGSGRQDLYLATDFNSDRVFFNEGGGRLRDASRLVVDKYSRNGMSAEIADPNNEGRASVYVTNIHEPPYALGRNMLWSWMPGDRFADTAEELGVSECGWSWGAKFLDLDDDGLQDLVVTNGYISADPVRNYWYQSGSMGGSTREVSRDARNWPSMEGLSLSGYQKKCVFVNKGWRFEDVADQTGWAEDRSDGRALAAIDVRNDGSLSLLQASQGSPLRLYRNERRNANHWVGFELEGSRSNRDAWGTVVRVRLEDKTLTRELQPANGFMSQSDGRLHFGLGPSPKISEVSVRWPSGRTQTLPAPELDRYHRLREPRDER